MLALLVDESAASVVGIGDLEGENVVDGVVAGSAAWSDIVGVSHWWLVAEKAFSLRVFDLVGN